MSTIADKLTTAIQVAEEARRAELQNPNNFIWKGPKKMVNGELVQEEVKLMDATPEQLNRYLDHCNSMLTSTDKNNPGRLVLLNIINDQRERCNAELFMRYVIGAYKGDGVRHTYQKYEYLQGINERVSENPELYPRDQFDKILFKSVTPVPDEFRNLTINLVQDACLCTLGVFDKKHITLNFITKLGLWLDDKEKKEFNEEAKETGKNRIDLIKERCGLRASTSIKISSKGLLNFKEFRALINLKTRRYTDLTIDQMVVLRDKVLFALENEVRYHISQWVSKIKEIVQVAQLKGIELTNYDPSLVA